MLILATSQTVTLTVSAGTATVEASYADRNGASFAEAAQRTSVTGGPTAVVSAPSAGVRLIKNIYVRAGSAATLTVVVGGATWRTLDIGAGQTMDLLADATLAGAALDAAVVHLAGTETISGAKTFASVDINGGTIDGTVIGGTTPAAIYCTTLTASLRYLAGTTPPDATTQSITLWKSGPYTLFDLVSSSASANERIWSWRHTGTYCEFAPAPDDYASSTALLRMTRSGATPGQVEILGTAPGTPSAGQVLIGGGELKTAGGVSCATLTASGRITGSATAATPTEGVLLTGSTTAASWHRIANTGGAFYFGMERSIGGYILSGSSAYAGICATEGTIPLQFGTNLTTRLTIDGSTGVSTFLGSAPGTPTAGQVLIGGGVAAAATGFNVGANQVVGARGAAVADATDAASVIARLNDLLSRLRTHGLIAT